MFKSFSFFLVFVVFGTCLYACGGDDEADLTDAPESSQTDGQTANDLPQDRPPVAPRDFGQAPAFQLPDLDGNPVSLAAFKGQVVAVNFWAAWCAPCRREIPDFVEVQAKHQDQGFTIIGISRDAFPDDEKAVRDFVKQFSMNYPILWDTQDVFKAYQGFGMPSTYMLDREHKIRFRHTGIVDKVTFEAEVLTLLNE
ncbi:MAG: TlpA disulfide reductase family protein [Candidatus Poribacteria bacterium]|nr:TlpA disulfide reductase family protein [Candidatus Poribacteria bacterium]